MNIKNILRKLGMGVFVRRVQKNICRLFTITHKNERVSLSVDSIYAGHHRVTYRGVEAIRCPFDFVIYEMIIYETKPDLIIEIGTNIGGGALYLADLLKNFGDGVLHTIDIVKQSDKSLLEHPRIKLFTNGWENYDLSEISQYKKVLVIDDGSHTYEDCIGILHKFSPVVSVGSYLIVEDGIINRLGLSFKYHGGPLRAIREFMKISNNFIIDRKWCDFFGHNATFNVNGYLKRIK
jgi:cephalosporin hydroxylase